MQKTITGNAAVFSQPDIDTDLIIPACYLTTSNAAELSQHTLEAIGGEKLKKISNPIVIAGNNFGCGSSREHAVWALVGSGVKAVIADGFARIFFRNSINFGLPTVVITEASEKFVEDDSLEIDFSKNVVRNLTQDKEYPFEPLPQFLLEIVEAGGLLNQIQK
ncbi:MAG: 3-isopropylmalate dehydratase [Candidatus Gracilibacteria bacterium]|nr:3-isopropylmalate dehydratase [Candidatus Gracilibacteria bacterium]MDD5179300.1 3-isopropylmalate dehydratase [Candidatus Gracilibacteria bacterium]